MALFRRDRAEPDAIKEAASEFGATRSVAQELTAIWRDVLGVTPLRSDDDFLDLGGQSIAFGQLAARIMDTFGVEVPLQRLFEARTIEAQAKLLEGYSAGSTPCPRPVRLSHGEDLPLASGQEGLW